MVFTSSQLWKSDSDEVLLIVIFPTNLSSGSVDTISIFILPFSSSVVAVIVAFNSL
jgi:hypothetical protein